MGRQAAAIRRLSPARQENCCATRVRRFGGRLVSWGQQAEITLDTMFDAGTQAEMFIEKRRCEKGACGRREKKAAYARTYAAGVALCRLPQRHTRQGSNAGRAIYSTR